MFATSQTVGRLIFCLVLSGGLHVGATALEWQTQPARTKTAGQPLEVTLNTVTTSRESRPSRRLPAPQAAPTRPRPTPKPTPDTPEKNPPKPVKKIIAKKTPRPEKKPVVQKEPAETPVVQAKADPPVPEPVSPLPDQTRFDLMARLKPIQEKLPIDQKVIATSHLSGTAGVSRLSSVKGRVDTVAKGNDLESDAKPMYWDNPLPEYPLQARRRHWEGVVWLHVEVSAKGVVVDLDLEKTSGHRVLDRSAEKAVRHWKFLPAKRAGIPVRCRVRVPVRFQLDES